MATRSARPLRTEGRRWSGDRAAPSLRGACSAPSSVSSVSRRPGHHQFVRGKRAQALGWTELPVGSEHGEAFSSLAGDLRGRRTWDVDEINERLEFKGATRLRMVQAPDQAHGIIVQLDRLVLDRRRALAQAWAALAQAQGPSGSPAVDWERLLAAHHQHSPAHIMSNVLGWSQDPLVLKNLSQELLEKQLPEALVRTAQPAPGLQRWLELVATYNMPVAAVTSLHRATALAVLAHLHLHDHFQALVSAADDGHESQAQTLLAAALRLGRPPNHCVVFDGCSDGVTAAHNASMKAVAVAGRLQPAWQLRSADVTVPSLDTLSVINVRRLFANRGADHGDLLKQVDPAQSQCGLDGAPSSARRAAWQHRSVVTTDAW